MTLFRLAFALLTAVALAAPAAADEEKLTLDKVPAKVTAAVKEKFKDAELVSASKETEDGKVLFEVQIKFQGKVIEVTATEDGTIQEIETTIDAKDLPKPVAEAIEKAYPKATIHKAETIEKGGKTDYEVLITTEDKKKTIEIKYDKDGKVVEMEDKTGKKDEDEDKKKDKK